MRLDMGRELCILLVQKGEVKSTPSILDLSMTEDSTPISAEENQAEQPANVSPIDTSGVVLQPADDVSEIVGAMSADNSLYAYAEDAMPYASIEECFKPKQRRVSRLHNSL